MTLAAQPLGEYAWVSCTVDDDPGVGRTRHLVREGGIDTLCHASASSPDIWQRGHRKPKCAECVKAAERMRVDH